VQQLTLVIDVLELDGLELDVLELDGLVHVEPPGPAGRSR
jgi:hypothetical protein